MTRRWLLCTVVLCVIVSACSINTTVTAQPVDQPTTAATSLPSEPADAEISTGAQTITPTTTLIAGSGLGDAAQDLFNGRVHTPDLLVDTIEHIATVERAEGPLHIFHYDRDGAFCAATFGEGTASDGCTGNDQMSFGKPFLRRTTARGSGEFHVWASNAPSDAAFFVVTSNTGAQFVSKVVNGTGYAITDSASVPVEARMVSADGVELWRSDVVT